MRTREREIGDPLFGATMTEARLKCGFSQKKLAAVTNISRRKIADIENGKNTSILILKTVMRTLGMTEIVLDGDLVLRVGSGGVEPGVVADLAQQIDRALALITDATLRLHALGRPAAPANRVADQNAKAESLIRDFTDRVRTCASAQELQQLDTALQALAVREPPAAKQGRRRRTKA